VSKSHLLAFESPKASNQRYLITNGPYTFQLIADIIRKRFPELKDKVPEGNPGEAFPDVYKLDTSKVQNELGLKFRSLEETVVDSVNSLLELQKSLS